MSYQFPRNVTVKHSGYKNTFDGTYFSVSRTVVDLIHEIGISYLFFGYIDLYLLNPSHVYSEVLP